MNSVEDRLRVHDASNVRVRAPSYAGSQTRAVPLCNIWSPRKPSGISMSVSGQDMRGRVRSPTSSFNVSLMKCRPLFRLLVEESNCELAHISGELRDELLSCQGDLLCKSEDGRELVRPPIVKVRV